MMVASIFSPVCGIIWGHTIYSVRYFATFRLWLISFLKIFTTVSDQELFQKMYLRIKITSCYFKRLKRKNNSCANFKRSLFLLTPVPGGMERESTRSLHCRAAQPRPGKLFKQINQQSIFYTKTLPGDASQKWWKPGRRSGVLLKCPRASAMRHPTQRGSGGAGSKLPTLEL